MNDETRSQPQIIVDLLRSTNGGAVSIDLIKAVLWSRWYPAPDNWAGAIDSLMRTVRFRSGAQIERVKDRQFVGFRICG